MMEYLRVDDHHIMAVVQGGEYLSRLITPTYKVNDEVTRWCDENTPGWSYDWDVFDDPKFFFVSREHAIGFKLRWG